MGKRFLIDTNVLIDAQMGRLSEKGSTFLAEIVNDDFTISFITYIEFLGYKDVTIESEAFIALANVLEMNKSIINICITLRKERKIKLPDAIIAATAIAYDLTLISRNTADFKPINGLTFIDPYSL